MINKEKAFSPIAQLSETHTSISWSASVPLPARRDCGKQAEGKINKVKFLQDLWPIDKDSGERVGLSSRKLPTLSMQMTS